MTSTDNRSIPEHIVEYLTPIQSLDDDQLRDAITWERGCGARPGDPDRLEQLRDEAQARHRRRHPSGWRHTNRSGAGGPPPDTPGPAWQPVSAWGDAPFGRDRWQLTFTLLEPGDPGPQRDNTDTTEEP